MTAYVNVRVEQTGVEMVVTKEHYDKYSKDYIHLGDVKPPVKKKPPVVKAKEE